jgi:hypothetical protein
VPLHGSITLVENDLASLIFEIVLFGPFSVPYQLLEPWPGPPCGWSFASPPFSEASGPATGYLEPAQCVETVPFRSDVPLQRASGSRDVAVQASLEGLASIDGADVRVQGRARLLTAFRLELDASYAGYFGFQGNPSPGWLGQAHVDIRFAQSGRVQFRAGAGVRTRFVDGGASAGVDGLYALDVFWLRHAVSTLELSGGSLGPDGWACEVRSTAGYLAGPFEAYLGWDAVWLGARNRPAVYLGGPVVGVRAYY